MLPRQRMACSKRRLYPWVSVQKIGHQFPLRSNREYPIRNVTPCWPQSKVKVERCNQTVLKIIRITNLEWTGCKKAVQDFLFHYRAAPHTVIGLSPADLLMGRRLDQREADEGNHPNRQNQRSPLATTSPRKGCMCKAKRTCGWEALGRIQWQCGTWSDPS